VGKETGLQVFENEKFGNVRVVIRDGEPWFVAADVCKVFGIVNNRNVTSRLDEDEKGVHDVDTVGGRQNVVIVNESGLYHMLFTMEPSNARGVKREDIELRIQQLKQFKRWITHDVIPALRKTGTYTITTKQDSYMIEDPIARAERWIEEAKERAALSAENMLLAGDQLKWADRNFINAAVRAYAGGACGGEFGIAWTNYKKELLYKHGINLNSRKTKYLNNTGKKTAPKTTSLIDESEMPNAVATIVALCRESKVDISELVSNLA
jgi:prophage antirepressor-like protein